MDKVMSLLLNMLSKLVITFLPRNKHLLISWLQSPSAVILEPKKIKSDTVSPSISHEVMGPDAMILVFWMLCFKSTFSLSSSTFIKRLLSSSSLSPIKVVSSAYLRLLIFLLEVLLLLLLLLLLPSRSSCVWLCATHRRQPTGLPHPWDSPGKNTGVGCHFLLQCMKVKSQSEVTQSCPTLLDPMDCSLPGSSVHGIFQASVLEWGAIAFSGNLVRNMQIKTTARECSAPVWKAILSLQRKTVEKTWRKENT